MPTVTVIVIVIVKRSPSRSLFIEVECPTPSVQDLNCDQADGPAAGGGPYQSFLWGTITVNMTWSWCSGPPLERPNDGW
jgi:hypothetical protein